MKKLIFLWLLLTLLAGIAMTQETVPDDPPEALPGTAPSEEGETPEPAPAEAVDSHRYFTRFSGFEPLYGSLGWRDHWNAKMQISFKYRFLNVDPESSPAGNWFNQFYFGYTQTTLWDLDSDSAPFYDTSYKPSLFFLRENSVVWSDTRFMHLQTGVEHESNGQAGAESRSLNIVYLRPIFHFDRLWGGRLTVAPKVYSYFTGLSDNPEIADYRGYVDLEVAWKDADGWKLATMLRKGTKSGYGSIQVDASYPLDKIFSGSFDAFLHLQYFNGWGESLLSYDQKFPAQFRVGIMLVR